MAEWDDRVEGLTRDHGRIVSVSTKTLGTTLTADVAAGATVLPVFDVGHFDAKYGGTLNINGARLAYATCDDDADIITLSDPLPAAALDGDFMACWDTLYDAPVTVKTAMVQLDGDDDNPDPIEALVPHFLVDKISDGDRGGPGESVVVGYDEDEDEWQILDVRGLASASGSGEKHCNTDVFTLTAAGDQSFDLSHTPDDGSLIVHWHPDGKGGVHMLPSEWTLDGSTLAVPDPGYFAGGDKIATEYDYRDGPLTPSIASSASPAGWTSGDNNVIYSSLPLPAGTQVGDLILFAGANAPTVTDPRLTYVTNPDGQGFYVGTATTLDDLQVSGGSANGAAWGVATFHNAQALSTQIIKGGASVAIPSVAPASAVALLALSGGGGGPPQGSVSFGPEYTEVGKSTADFSNVCCAYWIDPNGTASPTTTATSSIGSPTTWVLVVRMA